MDLKKLVLCAFFLTGNFLISQSNTAQPTLSKTKQTSFDPATLLWYNKPASKWEEALPVGNGRPRGYGIR